MECRISSLLHLYLMISRKYILLIKNILLAKCLSVQVSKCMFELPNIVVNSMFTFFGCAWQNVVEKMEIIARLLPKSIIYVQWAQSSSKLLSWSFGSPLFQSEKGKLPPLDSSTQVPSEWRSVMPSQNSIFRDANPLLPISAFIDVFSSSESISTKWESTRLQNFVIHKVRASPEPIQKTAIKCNVAYFLAFTFPFMRMEGGKRRLSGSPEDPSESKTNSILLLNYCVSGNPSNPNLNLQSFHVWNAWSRSFGVEFYPNCKIKWTSFSFE